MFTVLGKVLDSFVAYAACVKETDNNCTEKAFRDLYMNTSNATQIEYIFFRYRTTKKLVDFGDTNDLFRNSYHVRFPSKTR